MTSFSAAACCLENPLATIAGPARGPFVNVAVGP